MCLCANSVLSDLAAASKLAISTVYAWFLKCFILKINPIRIFFLAAVFVSFYFHTSLSFLLPCIVYCIYIVVIILIDFNIGTAFYVISIDRFTLKNRKKFGTECKTKILILDMQ